ncbi:ATP-dependent DNA helicase Q4 [Fasciolopsis buskii]|uniref:ATP-dependent DNA helicase Q4 n=1 Tax=Fasciolopsis buskii TaxID=27845 RepID=A0A8E0VF14_9TREM|nr:ATP-dependent DNA helicase Q4 [Fasciolopsis buski]
MVKRLLRVMFQGVTCTCRPSESDSHFRCPGHVHTIIPAEVERDLDIKPESLATLLAYMELDEQRPLITLLQRGYKSVGVDCYGGPAEMAYASQHCLAVAAGVSVACEEKNPAERSEYFTSLRQLSLDLPYLCNRWGWRPSTVRQEVKNLEWHSSAGSGAGPDRTGIRIQLSDWSWWFWIHHVPVREDLLEDCLKSLIHRLRTVETAGLNSLDQLTHVLAHVARPQFDQIYPDQSSVSSTDLEMVIQDREERSSAVHKLIQTHFQTTRTDPYTALSSDSKTLLEFFWPPPVTDSQLQCVRSTIRDFLATHGPSLGEQISGRSLANLFHGISSPQFPVTIWARNNHVWRKHLDVDWPQLNKIASEELRRNVHMFL